jgi:hypothetical protein
MSNRDSDPSAGPADAEPVLQRWSRLKAQARAAERTQAQPESNPPPAAPATSEAAPPAERIVELPDLDLMGQDSDYSAFLAPGVDLSLRRRALRKLFASPKFNVFDGLDTYRDDFTSFPALGDIVTADMRHQVERLARKALQNLEGNAADEPVPATKAPANAPGIAVSADKVDDLAPPALPACGVIHTTADPTTTLATTAITAPAPASTADIAPQQPAVSKENG